MLDNLFIKNLNFVLIFQYKVARVPPEHLQGLAALC